MKPRIIIIFFIVIGLIGFLGLSGFLRRKSESEIPIETKISQMIVIGFNGSSKSIKDIRKNITDGNISGVIFYKRNIKNPAQIKNQIKEFNKISKNKYPLFMVTDQEGGRVSRIKDTNGFRKYPSALAISDEKNKDNAYKIYKEMALDLKNIGINFNLAPCVDIKTNPKSSIAKDFRIYGNNPEIVADYSTEFIKAHNDVKVITALKHFPGLGNAEFDTHKTLPDITKSWSEFELLSFKKIIEKFPKEPVMVGHVLNKKIDSDNISSLSYKTISILKTMNHQGIVLADAVDMSAVNEYEIGEILIKSINSGVNLFIFPNHVIDVNNAKIYMEPKDFIKIVKNAIKEGKISKEKIDISYGKIIDLKRRFIDEDI